MLGLLGLSHGLNLVHEEAGLVDEVSLDNLDDILRTSDLLLKALLFTGAQIFGAFSDRVAVSHLLVPEADDVFTVGDSLAEFMLLINLVGELGVEVFVLDMSVA